VFDAVKNTRRDFLKTLGVAALGTGSTMFDPASLLADTQHKNAAEIMAGARGNARGEINWNFIRAQFRLKPGLIHMNTGTEGAMPRMVLSAIGGYFKTFASNPMHYSVEDPTFMIGLQEVCAKTAAFVGANTDEIAMTTNTTEGLGFCASGLDLKEGDEVLVSKHFEPYDTCWRFLRDRRNITFTEVELPTPATSSAEIVEKFRNAISPKTKVMSFCHINYTTGLQMPVKELCQLASENNIITVIDGAHAIGMLDVDLHDIGCDFYAAALHKWLCAPPGTGILYMKKESQEYICATVSEWYTENNPYLCFIMRGQQCSPAYVAVKDAIDFQNAIGKEKIQSRVLALSNYTKDKIVEEWGRDALLSPTEEALSTGLVAFNPFGTRYGPKYGGDITNLYNALREKNIVTRPIAFMDKLDDTQFTKILRISTHIYNGIDQINKMIDEAKKVINTI
jgi:selenocysteine lyase/cysteine desulfurase